MGRREAWEGKRAHVRRGERGITCQLSQESLLSAVDSGLPACVVAMCALYCCDKHDSQKQPGEERVSFTSQFIIHPGEVRVK